MYVCGCYCMCVGREMVLEAGGYAMVWFGTGMYAAHCTALYCTVLYCTAQQADELTALHFAHPSCQNRDDSGGFRGMALYACMEKGCGPRSRRVYTSTVLYQGFPFPSIYNHPNSNRQRVPTGGMGKKKQRKRSVDRRRIRSG